MGGAPGHAAVVAVGIADVADVVAGIHADTAVRQKHGLGLAGLAHIVGHMLAPTPGSAAVIGVDGAGPFLAGGIVVDLEQHPLGTVLAQLHGQAAAGAHAHKAFALLLYVQNLGLAPLNAGFGHGTGAQPDVEGGIDFPFRLAVEHIVLHGLAGDLLLAQRLHNRITAGLVQIVLCVHPCAGQLTGSVLDGIKGAVLAFHEFGLGGLAVDVTGIVCRFGGSDLAGFALCNHQIAVCIKAGALFAGGAAVLQAGIGRAGVHHHVNGAVLTLEQRRVNEGRALFVSAGGLVRVIGKMVDHLPFPGLAAVPGKADQPVQIVGSVHGGAPAGVRRGQNPAVVQRDHRRNAEPAAGTGLVRNIGLAGGHTGMAALHRAFVAGQIAPAFAQHAGDGQVLVINAACTAVFGAAGAGSAGFKQQTQRVAALLGQAGILIPAREVHLCVVQPGNGSGVCAQRANADHTVGAAVARRVGGQHQIAVDLPLRALHITGCVDEGHHAVGGIVQRVIRHSLAPGCAAVVAVCAGDLTAQIAAENTHAAVRQVHHLRLAGLAAAGQVVHPCAAGPGCTVIIAVNHAGILVAGGVIVQGEHDALFAVHRGYQTTAGAHAGEGFIFGILDIQEGGFAPHQAVRRNFGAAQHDVEHRVGLPGAAAVEQIGLHHLAAVQLLPHDLFHGIGLAVPQEQIQLRIHPITGGFAALGGDGVQLQLGTLHRDPGRLCIQIHPVGVGALFLGSIAVFAGEGHQHAALLVKAAALIAHPVAAHQAGVGGAGIHHHVQLAVRPLHHGGVDEGGAGLAGGAVGLIVKVVYDLVAPGLAAVPGNAHDGIQVLGGVGGGLPAHVRRSHQPAVVQRDQGGDAVVLAVAAIRFAIHKGLAFGGAGNGLLRTAGSQGNAAQLHRFVSGINQFTGGRSGAAGLACGEHTVFQLERAVGIFGQSPLHSRGVRALCVGVDPFGTAGHRQLAGARIALFHNRLCAHQRGLLGLFQEQLHGAALLAGGKAAVFHSQLSIVGADGIGVVVVLRHGEQHRGIAAEYALAAQAQINRAIRRHADEIHPTLRAGERQLRAGQRLVGIGQLTGPVVPQALVCVVLATGGKNAEAIVVAHHSIYTIGQRIRLSPGVAVDFQFRLIQGDVPGIEPEGVALAFRQIAGAPEIGDMIGELGGIAFAVKIQHTAAALDLPAVARLDHTQLYRLSRYHIAFRQRQIVAAFGVLQAEAVVHGAAHQGQILHGKGAAVLQPGGLHTAVGQGQLYGDGTVRTVQRAGVQALARVAQVQSIHLVLIGFILAPGHNQVFLAQIQLTAGIQRKAGNLRGTFIRLTNIQVDAVRRFRLGTPEIGLSAGEIAAVAVDVEAEHPVMGRVPQVIGTIGLFLHGQIVLGAGGHAAVQLQPLAGCRVGEGIAALLVLLHVQQQLIQRKLLAVFEPGSAYRAVGQGQLSSHRALCLQGSGAGGRAVRAQIQRVYIVAAFPLILSHQ